VIGVELFVDPLPATWVKDEERIRFVAEVLVVCDGERGERAHVFGRHEFGVVRELVDLFGVAIDEGEAGAQGWVGIVEGVDVEVAEALKVDELLRVAMKRCGCLG